MKKLLITLGLSAVATAGFAQGTVNVPNTSATTFRTNGLATAGTSGVTASSTVAPNGYYYEVLTAPSTVTTVDSSLQALLTPTWSDTGLSATNSSFATGGRTAGKSGASGVANFWAAGALQSYIVVGWSADLGSSWSQVSAKLAGATFSGGAWNGVLLSAGQQANSAFLGATVVANGTSGQSTGIGAYSLFGSAGAAGTPVTGPTDLFVVQTPEPSTFALAGLGAAALMIFRRRKQ